MMSGRYKEVRGGMDFLHETRDATEINNLRFAFNGNDKILQHLEDGQCCIGVINR